MADQDFNIKVVTTADTTGIQQTSDELGKLKQKAIEEAKSAVGPLPVPPQIEDVLAGLPTVAAGAFGTAAVLGRQLYSIIKDVSEFQAKLNEEIGKEVVALDKAILKWQDMAHSADSLQDLARVGSSVAAAVQAISDRTRVLNSQALTVGQTFKEAFTVLIGLTQVVPRVWTPYSNSLREAQEEQKKLNELTIEQARNAIEAAQASKASWDWLKSEDPATAVDIATKKLKAYEDQQKKVNLSTEEGVQQWEFYQQKINETTAHLDVLKRKLDEANKVQEKQLQQQQNNLSDTVEHASAGVRHVLDNEQAAQKARAEGRDRDADQFEKAAEEFKRGLTPEQEAELQNIRNLQKPFQPPPPPGPQPIQAPPGYDFNPNTGQFVPESQPGSATSSPGTKTDDPHQADIAKTLGDVLVELRKQTQQWAA